MKDNFGFKLLLKIFVYRFLAGSLITSRSLSHESFVGLYALGVF